ncbi:MAG: hypothetical protein HC884_17365 [Chloroflexaceae bacterium]|nr:hypothetical protein [Chloroflexaceae bacterium]
MTGQGLLASLQGSYAAACAFCRLALEIARENGEPFAEGDACLYLGHAHRGAGLLEDAAACYEQALSIWLDLEMDHRVVEVRAGLALVALARDEHEQARQHVEHIWSSWQENQTFAGADQPFLVFEACYRVLLADQDPRVEEVIHATRSLLCHRAERTADRELRRSFLERVVTNRDLLEATREHVLALNA